jgi:hypothetical protein
MVNAVGDLIRIDKALLELSRTQEIKECKVSYLCGSTLEANILVKRCP